MKLICFLVFACLLLGTALGDSPHVHSTFDKLKEKSAEKIEGAKATYNDAKDTIEQAKFRAKEILHNIPVGAAGYVKESVGSMADSVKSSVGSMGSIKESIKESVGSMKESAQGSVGSIQEKAGATIDAIKETVNVKPTAAPEQANGPQTVNIDKLPEQVQPLHRYQTAENFGANDKAMNMAEQTVEKVQNAEFNVDSIKETAQRIAQNIPVTPVMEAANAKVNDIHSTLKKTAKNVQDMATDKMNDIHSMRESASNQASKMAGSFKDKMENIQEMAKNKAQSVKETVQNGAASVGTDEALNAAKKLKQAL